jgi:hypothetical protein
MAHAEPEAKEAGYPDPWPGRKVLKDLTDPYCQSEDDRSSETFD